MCFDIAWSLVFFESGWDGNFYLPFVMCDTWVISEVLCMVAALYSASYVLAKIT